MFQLTVYVAKITGAVFANALNNLGTSEPGKSATQVDGPVQGDC